MAAPETMPQSRARFHATSAVDLDLRDDPIDPSWVIAGEPRARVLRWAESEDQTTTHWVWDCTAGTFRWYFAADETVHIIEGGVVVQGEDGARVELGLGDAAYFPAGQWTTWTVEHYVRKHAVIRTPVVLGPLATLVRRLGNRRHRLPQAA